jgi:hypothetical protein
MGMKTECRFETTTFAAKPRYLNNAIYRKI